MSVWLPGLSRSSPASTLIQHLAWSREPCSHFQSCHPQVHCGCVQSRPQQEGVWLVCREVGSAGPLLPGAWFLSLVLPFWTSPVVIVLSSVECAASVPFSVAFPRRRQLAPFLEVLEAGLLLLALPVPSSLWPPGAQQGGFILKLGSTTSQRPPLGPWDPLGSSWSVRPPSSSGPFCWPNALRAPGGQQTRAPEMQMVGFVWCFRGHFSGGMWEDDTRAC